MQVLLEHTEGLVRVTSGPPVEIVAEGETEEEALTRLQEAVRARLQGGARLIDVPLGSEFGSANPWLDIAGIFSDDTQYDEWQQAIRENRLRRDAEDGPW